MKTTYFTSVTCLAILSSCSAMPNADDTANLNDSPRLYLAPQFIAGNVGSVVGQNIQEFTQFLTSLDPAKRLNTASALGGRSHNGSGTDCNRPIGDDVKAVFGLATNLAVTGPAATAPVDHLTLKLWLSTLPFLIQNCPERARPSGGFELVLWQPGVQARRGWVALDVPGLRAGLMSKGQAFPLLTNLNLKVGKVNAQTFDLSRNILAASPGNTSTYLVLKDSRNLFRSAPYADSSQPALRLLLQLKSREDSFPTQYFQPREEVRHPVLPATTGGLPRMALIPGTQERVLFTAGYIGQGTPEDLFSYRDQVFTNNVNLEGRDSVRLRLETRGFADIRYSAGPCRISPSLPICQDAKDRGHYAPTKLEVTAPASFWNQGSLIVYRVGLKGLEQTIPLQIESRNGGTFTFKVQNLAPFSAQEWPSASAIHDLLFVVKNGNQSRAVFLLRQGWKSSATHPHPMTNPFPY